MIYARANDKTKTANCTVLNLELASVGPDFDQSAIDTQILSADIWLRNIQHFDLASPITQSTTSMQGV